MQRLRRIGCLLALACSVFFGPIALSVAQIPGGNNIVINNTPITGGTSGQCLYDNAGKVGEQACGGGPGIINVGNYMTTAQLATAQAGANTQDLTTQILAANTACTAALRCILEFPPGYFYTATCNIPVTVPTTIRGAGAASIDLSEWDTIVRCGSTTAKLFNVTSTSRFGNIALVNLTAAASGSSAIYANPAVTGRVDYDPGVMVYGFYDSIYSAVGDSWNGNAPFLTNCVHTCLTITNTANYDSGDWVIFNLKAYPLSSATCAIDWQSSDGGKILGGAFLTIGGGQATHAICINLTGATPGQVTIQGNKFETFSSFPVFITKAGNYVNISGNIIRSSVGGMSISATTNLKSGENTIECTGPAYTLTSVTVATIGPDQLNCDSVADLSGGGNSVAVIQPTFQSTVALLPDATQTVRGSQLSVTNAATTTAGVAVVALGNVHTPVVSNASGWLAQFAVTSTAYSGPGDAVSGASAWWGLRAYNLAAAGTPAANICNALAVTCADISTLASGAFDVATAQGVPLSCGGVGGTCTVKKLYDQSGALACAAGTPCDLVMSATEAERPVLTFGCTGLGASLPCMTSSTATANAATAVNFTLAQPYTLVGAAKRTGSLTAYNTIVANFNGTSGLYYHTTGNADFLVNNVDHAFVATNSAWHALQAVGNGASSSGTTDGSTTAISAATTAFASAGVIRVFNDGGGDQMDGPAVEMGIWPTAFSGGNLAAMNTNIHSYWGF